MASRCEAVKCIGDAGYFRLECNRDEDSHAEALHWDHAYEIAWSPWTQDDEDACKEADS